MWKTFSCNNHIEVFDYLVDNKCSHKSIKLEVISENID